MTDRAMEHDIYTSPDGKVLPLSTRGAQYKLLESGDAMGGGLLELATVRGPFQDGYTVTFQRLGARDLLMTLSRQDCPREDWWDARARLLNLLRPNRLVAGPYSRPVPGFLRKYMPDGIDYRDLFVEARSIDFNTEPPDQTPGPLQCSVAFYAADPLWYGPAATALYALRGISGLRFPAAFEPPVTVAPLPLINVWIFGGENWKDTQTLQNMGTWHTYPVITVTGALDSVAIDNLTTGESVTFNGTIPPGLVFTIDLTYGQKRAYDSAGTDYSGYLDGDVGEFHIACDPEATNGNNVIQVSIGGGDASTSVQIDFRSPYVGI